MNYSERLRAHESAAPCNEIEPLLLLEGYSAEESFLHHRFRHLRIGLGGRETFSYCDEIINYIKDCKDNHLSLPAYVANSLENLFLLEKRNNYIDSIINDLISTQKIP